MVKRTNDGPAALVAVAILGLAACRGAAPPSTPKPEIGAASSREASGIVALRGAVEAGRGDDADAIAAKLTPEDRASRTGRVLLGRLAELHGAGSEAKSLYEAVLVDEPGHLEASLALGVRLLEEGDTAGAMGVTDAGLKAHPGDASLLLNRAYVVLAAEGFPPASEAFLLAEKASTGLGVVRLSFASALAKAGRATEAVEVLARIVADARSGLGELAEAGHSLRQLGAFAPALMAFARVVAQHDGGEVRVERALCKVGLRDGEGALKELDAGLKVEPAYAPLHFYRGGRLAEVRRWKEAKVAYEQYLALAPEGPLADLAKKRLRSLAVTLEK